jgi:peptide/nickel transport system permease protein
MREDTPPLAVPVSPVTGSAGPIAGSADADLARRAEEAGADYEVTLKSLSQWELAWRKFRKHRLALLGSAILVVLVLAALIGPIFMPFDFASIPTPDVFVNNGRGPSIAHPFGETGGLQRDVLMLVLNGARTSLFIGFSSMLIGVVLGTVVGSLAGFLGGFVDNIMMRVVDVMLSLPLLFVILVAARFFASVKDNVWTIVLIFGLFSWMGVSRLVRGLFLSIREREFVEAARAVGVRDRRIIFRHILPNALSPILVAATLIVAGNIIGEAFVSFLGYGVNPVNPTWGNILTNALAFIPNGNWWWPLFPGVAIILTVLSVNFIGDGLRDAFDPRTRA